MGETLAGTLEFQEDGKSRTLGFVIEDGRIEDYVDAM